jgi:hypothetical protein
MNLQPEILLHPNIPKPLHGLAPRTIKGDDWWNKERQKAYSKNNYKCWSCGIDKLQAKYHKWLEAHEIYKINYTIGEVKFIDICALCHSCHNFIHSGRLFSLYQKGEIKYDKIYDILKHGFDILKNTKLEINPFALRVAKEVNEKLHKEYSKYKIYSYGICLAKWEDWYMLIDNKKYKGKFKTFEEWEEFYN